MQSTQGTGRTQGTWGTWETGYPSCLGNWMSYITLSHLTMLLRKQPSYPGYPHAKGLLRNSNLLHLLTEKDHRRRRRRRKQGHMPSKAEPQKGSEKCRSKSKWFTFRGIHQHSLKEWVSLWWEARRIFEALLFLVKEWRAPQPPSEVGRRIQMSWQHYFL